MIDTDKYEGHTPAPWMMGEYKGRPSIYAGDETFVRSIARGLNPSQTADHNLIADAPLLLERVIRLQSYIAHHETMRTYARYRQCPECGSIDFTFKFNDESMECNCDKCDNRWTVKLE